MKKIFIMACVLLAAIVAEAQQVSGTIVDKKSHLPVEGATVTVIPANISTVTDINGHFSTRFNGQPVQQLAVSSLGYVPDTINLGDFEKTGLFALRQRQVMLSDVVVTANTGSQLRTISKADIAMRGVNNSQEILRIVPGLVIGQHQGGGKAEQIFLRGFDADHGTDVRLEADGLPINMVGHAHGQGYADSHFLIPETSDAVDYQKGPYNAGKGDFATAGFAEYRTRNFLASNVLKAEAGMFNTYRVLGMFNLLPASDRANQQSWYAAAEYRYSDSYFDNPQNFNRFNFFTKYNGRISGKTSLAVSASTFSSKWDASGQIPVRAVEQGIIGFYGAIDPDEGGTTSRSLVNAIATTTFKNGSNLKNQVYFTHSNFELFSNFTFFLDDPINGDQIRQREKRNMYGYRGSYTNNAYIGNAKLVSEIGADVRADATTGSELSHTVNRTNLLNRIKYGDIDQLNIGPYVSETLTLGSNLVINAGLRYDHFNFSYNNLFAGDATLPGEGIYKTSAATVSPKLNVSYRFSKNLQVYVSSGKGFHSNDARAAVVQNGEQILPAAYGADAGSIFKPAKNVVINAAIWYIYLQQEYVYSGDGGFVEFSGKTRRYGLDVSARYQLLHNLYIDADVNYAHARTLEVAKGEDRVPLAPEFSGSGGFTYQSARGFNANLRYRFITKRPANETNTIVADGYFVSDAGLGYAKSKYEVNIFVNNLLNTKWKETQFNTETRLKSEVTPVEEVCFTPGTPFAARLSVSYFFGR